MGTKQGWKYSNIFCQPPNLSLGTEQAVALRQTGLAEIPLFHFAQAQTVASLRAATGACSWSHSLSQPLTNALTYFCDKILITRLLVILFPT
jgi:hypothetical protein